MTCPDRSRRNACRYGRLLAYRYVCKSDVRSRPDRRRVNPVEAAMTDINREEVHARLAASEARVATTVTDMRADLKTGLSEIRTDMEKMRGSMETMRADIHQMFSAQTKWIVLIVFGALATAGTIWAFLKPWDPMPSTPSVPLVIYAQPFPAQVPPAVASDSRPKRESAPST